MVAGPHAAVVQGVVCPSVHLRELSPACGHLPEGPPSSALESAAFLPSLSWTEPQLGGGARFSKRKSSPQSYGNVTVFRI